VHSRILNFGYHYSAVISKFPHLIFSFNMASHDEQFASWQQTTATVLQVVASYATAHFILDKFAWPKVIPREKFHKLSIRDRLALSERHELEFCPKESTTSFGALQCTV
jgi:hypothetical protein